MNIGVREGGVLSPLLFIIYFSDLQEKVFVPFPSDVGFSPPTLADGTVCDHAVYADDLVVLAVDVGSMQYRMNLLSLYCHKKKLTVSVMKTEVMYFTNSRMRVASSGIFYNGHELPLTSNFKYLGFWFNSKLTESSHRENKLAKYSAASSVFLDFARKLDMFAPRL